MNHDFQWKHEDLWTNTPWTLGISGDSTWILLKDYSFAMWQHQSLPWIKEGTGARSGIPCPNVEDHQQHAHWVNMHPTDRMPFQYKKLHQKLDAWFQVGLFGKSTNNPCFGCFFRQIVVFPINVPINQFWWDSSGGRGLEKNTQWSSPTHSKNINLSKGI